jgi:GH15 family glucan-1,4-alpha-glucosidase
MTTNTESEIRYPPISSYGYIADCHSAALVSRYGSIDWCCMPRLDSESCFGRLLGWGTGGYCRIAPRGTFQSDRRYREGTLVLETTFRTGEGVACLIDCFSMRRGGEHNPHRQILRIVEGVEGSQELELDFVPRFDYGAIKPWIREYRDNSYIAIGGDAGLLISGDVRFEMKGRHHIAAAFSLRAGKRVHISILWRRPEELDEGNVQVPAVDELDSRLAETTEWWIAWSSKAVVDGPYADLACRSAIVLKGLSNSPTGAIAAAPTTSLPESPGGSRNWDYRYSWIRDSVFTVRSLAELGCDSEADGFRRFIERCSAGSAQELQILFGIVGQRRLHEFTIEELEGFRGARPVRVGNGAEGQVQLDVYGELLELAWSWHKMGYSPDRDYWEFLVEIVNHAARLWSKPDQGIWELRGEPHHFVFSKVMCWVALDRGIRLAEEVGHRVPADKWKKTRDEIRSSVERNGYDEKRGVFTQAYELRQMDSALLLIPVVGFLDFKDERIVRTTDAVWQELQEDGLLLRYPRGCDGLEGEEGVFLACSFWLVEVLAGQGRLEEAHRVFKRAVATGNDLGLFSEEYDTRNGEMLGNFPQGLTHLSMIAAVVALGKAEKSETGTGSAEYR